MNAKQTTSMLAIVIFLALAAVSPAVQPNDKPAKEPVETAEEVVTKLYELVTFTAGTQPDWDKVRSVFATEAIVVLRTARDKTTLFDVDGFVADFVRFAETPAAKERGFTEKVLRTKAMVFGDIAHILVLYEASINESQRPPQQGIDSFQLVRKGGRWLIVSITNEIVTPDRPIPPELQKKG